MAPPTAVQLKEEGNALFVKKDFVHACKKYTEAIALDGQNAVLYANRSACNLGMGRLLDASQDAQQATIIDPSYAKGWSRLAAVCDAALEFTRAVWAWEKAIDALPKTGLSPAERKQKEQYMASLQKAKQHLRTVPSVTSSWIVSNSRTEKLPWQVAEEILPELPAKYLSSAYVIHFANQEFAQGIKHMKSLKKVRQKYDPDGVVMFGHTDGLACITNGLMRDLRVFRIDCRDWLQKYSDQLYFQAEKRRAWILTNIEDVQQRALERLKEEGWNTVRPALAIVVRGWIMRAFIDCKLREMPHAAVKKLKETLELLRWGCQVWRDVSKADRGVVFQDTFITGVRAMYLDTLMAAHAKATDEDKRAVLDTLLKAARELVKDMQDNPAQPTPEPVDPGFFLSFCVYPAAEAHAMIGYCFVHMARSSDNPIEKRTNHILAAEAYNKGARMLPEDDEKYCWYLNCSIDNMLQAGVSKDAIEPVANAIRVAMPKMQRIWQCSALAKQDRDVLIEQVLCIAERR